MSAARPPRSKRPQPKLLVNKLSVDDARHLLKNEGGELSVAQIALRVVMATVIWGLCAFAIWRGDATAWHLGLPLVAEYLTLLVVFPLAVVFMNAPALKREAFQAVWWYAGITIAVGVYVFLISRRTGSPFTEQLAIEWQRLFDWIVGSYMHWPILGAMVSMAVSFPQRITNFKKHGPPFVGVSLGCAMRFVVLLFTGMLIPLAEVTTERRLAWFFWSCFAFAEFASIYFHWDLQRRLRKLDEPFRKGVRSEWHGHKP